MTAHHQPSGRVRGSASRPADPGRPCSTAAGPQRRVDVVDGSRWSTRQLRSDPRPSLRRPRGPLRHELSPRHRTDVLRPHVPVRPADRRRDAEPGVPVNGVVTAVGLVWVAGLGRGRWAGAAAGQRRARVPRRPRRSTDGAALEHRAGPGRGHGCVSNGPRRPPPVSGAHDLALMVVPVVRRHRAVPHGGSATSAYVARGFRCPRTRLDPSSAATPQDRHPGGREGCPSAGARVLPSSPCRPARRGRTGGRSRHGRSAPRSAAACCSHRPPSISGCSGGSSG